MASADVFQSTPDMSFNSDGDTDCSTNRRISGIISLLESPMVKTEITETEDHLLATQPVKILKDVAAYVEVRTGAENRSKAIISKLRQLGATVVDKLSDEVTHVVWKGGKKSTVDRARKRNIPVVTVLWVDSCMQNETRVSENLFSVQDDKQKGTPVHLPRLKKTKSMQPKDFDEDVASSAERGERIRKRRENKDKKKPKSPSKNPAFFVAETQPLSPFLGSPFSPNLAVPDTPASLRERFNCIKRNMQEIQESESDGPESPIAVKPGRSDGLPIHRKLFGGYGSPLSTPPSSPQPLSTSTQESPVKLSVKCEPIGEEDCDQRIGSSLKDSSPARRPPLSPVTNTVNSPIRSVESPSHTTIRSDQNNGVKLTADVSKIPTSPAKQSDPISPRKSPRFAKAQDKKGKEKAVSDNEKNTNNGRIVAKPRKKKLYSTAMEPKMELTVPTSASSTSVVEDSALGVSGLKVRKGRPKNHNSTIRELAGVPKQMKGPKRKRSKTSDSESDCGKVRKKSKTSSSSEDDNKPRKARKPDRSYQETDDSFSELEDEIRNSKIQRKISSNKLTKFTDIKETSKKKSSKAVSVDILQQDFESEYEESTLYLNTQSNKSKVWATTSVSTQPSQLLKDKVTRRRSNKVSVASINSRDSGVASMKSKTKEVTDVLNEENQQIATTEIKSDGSKSKRRSVTPVTESKVETEPMSRSIRTTRRRSIAVSSPATVEDATTTRKGRRKSVAVSSPSVTFGRDTQAVNSVQQSTEMRKTRRRSALVSNEADDVNGDSDGAVKIAVVGSATSGKTTGRRRTSMLVPATISEEPGVKKTAKQDITSVKNQSPVTDDKTVNNVEETPELTKSKPRRRSGIHTPVLESQPVDISDKTIRTVLSPTVHTPVSRRRSMRVMAISNSMQKAGTPMSMYGEASTSTIELAREKDDTISNEISVATTSNKCPADFDSTAEDWNLLELVKRKKKKGLSSSQVSQKSKTEQRNGSTVSTDSGISPVDTASYLSSVSVLSPTSKSRKSIDDFRPETFNISTQKRIRKSKLAKPAFSDIESSEEEETKPVNSSKSKKHKTQSTVGRKGKVSTSDIASDANLTDTTSRQLTKLKNKRNSSKSSAESTCSSASDTNDDKGKRRRKRSSGSKSPKYPNSLVMTSLHFSEQDTVKGVVKQMGGFHVVDQVDDTTTHVVCGGNRRTLNVLYAIAQGCWLVSQEWVFNSLETGKWMEEEPFEVHDYFPACQIARLERATTVGAYKQDLFSQTGLIFVCEGTSPPTRNLIDLIQMCSGQITRCPRKADLVIGGVKTANTCVSEQWVLDSITAHRGLPVEPYIIGVDGKLVRSPSPDY